MIPTIGLLLCVYLVFKGVEIFQLGYCQEKPGPKILGLVALIASVGLAGVFALMFILSDPSVRQMMR